jgi:hypothetical protein
MSAVPGVFGNPFFMVIWLREKWRIPLPPPKPKPQWQFITWRYKGIILPPQLRKHKRKIKYRSSFAAIVENESDEEEQKPKHGRGKPVSRGGRAYDKIKLHHDH